MAGNGQRSDLPLRDLYMALQRLCTTPAYSEVVLVSPGVWQCEVRAVGLCSRGSSSTKKNAKREAVHALLQMLQVGPAMLGDGF